MQSTTDQELIPVSQCVSHDIIDFLRREAGGAQKPPDQLPNGRRLFIPHISRRRRMELPAGWEARECKDYPGRCYYYNSLTNQSTWVRPSASPPPFIYLSHIAVKHSRSRTPRGRGNAQVTRSTDSAREKMGNIRADLLRDQSRFKKIAAHESDIGGADGGLLGWVRPGDLPPDFVKVAWGLAAGEMSGVFETKLGFHLLLRHE
jgi:hypothetical protein